MKALKKDLVDALKELLLNDAQMLNNVKLSSESSSFPKSVGLQSSDAQAEAEKSATDNGSVRAPIRKGSLMAEFRNLVHEKSGEDEDDDEGGKEATSESQSLPSSCLDNLRGQNQQQPEMTAKSDKSPFVSPTRDAKVVESPESTWMEVASPLPEQQSTLHVSTGTACENPATVGLPPTTPQSNIDHMQVCSPASENGYPVSSPAKSMDVQEMKSPSDINEHANTDNVLSTSFDTLPAPAPVVKKPLNLVGGQSSFFDKPVAPRTVVVSSLRSEVKLFLKNLNLSPSTISFIQPALEKAKLLKAADEAKALQKKKDLEKKVASVSVS